MILICFVSELKFFLLIIGKKMYIKEMARIKPDNIVKIPPAADLYEPEFEKYIGVLYSPREIFLKNPLIRMQQVFFCFVLSDL